MAAGESSGRRRKMSWWGLLLVARVEALAPFAVHVRPAALAGFCLLALSLLFARFLLGLRLGLGGVDKSAACGLRSVAGKGCRLQVGQRRERQCDGRGQRDD